MKRVSLILLVLIPTFTLTTLSAQTLGTEARREVIRRSFLHSFYEKTGTTPDKLQDARVFRLKGHGSKGESSAPLGGKEVVVSKSVSPESELHAAINPGDTNNIVVGAMLQSSSGLSFPIYYTKDLGNTWRKATFNDQPYSGSLRAGGGDPMFTYNVDGSVAYMTWIDVALRDFIFDSIYANIFFATSTNGGQSWKTSLDQTLVSEILINDGGSQAGGAFPDKEWLTCDRSNSAHRGTIYGSYLLFTQDSVTLHVASMKSGETTFTTRRQVSLANIVALQIATLDADSAGRLHITFHGTEDAKVYNIYHVVSADGALTFSEPKIISRAEIASHSSTSAEYVIPGFADRQVPSVQVACGRAQFADEVYCVWDALGVAENANNGSEVFFSRSTDGGATWSAPLVVNKDVGEITSEQYRATITVNDKGVICVGWYDGRESSDNTAVHYYTAFSFDGGRTFVAEQPVTTKTMDFTTVGLRNGEFGVGEYMQIVATPHLAIPIWSDARKGTGDLDIYAAIVPIATEVLGVRSISNIDAGITLESVYPNPAADHLSVSLSLLHNEAVTVSLIDMLGNAQAVKIYELSAGSNTVEHSFNLPAGNYILRLTTKEGSVSRVVQIVK